MLPLYLYDHSGITMATKPFSCSWDSGCVGFIYATKANIKLAFGKSQFHRHLRKQAFEVLQGEVETYDQYLTGDVWGYRIVDEVTDEELDSCWGFYGEACCQEAADETLKHLQKKAKTL
jgi:hypothetical protein